MQINKTSTIKKQNEQTKGKLMCCFFLFKENKQQPRENALRLKAQSRSPRLSNTLSISSAAAPGRAPLRKIRDDRNRF